MTITRNFKLCLNAGTQNAPYINVNQYDEGEQWIFDLYTEGGQKFTPSTGAIIGIKSDGNAILNSGTVNSDGQVVITETQQMTAASGLAVFELLIEGETHGTANFIVNVERRPSDDAEFSDSDLSMLQEAIDAAEVINEILDEGGDPSEIIAENVNNWLDNHPEATTTVQDGAITAPKINNSLWDKILVNEEASGNPASFDDGADDVPVSSLKVALEPIQTGTGDPSPTNIRPITGHTSTSVTRTGKNFLPSHAVGSTTTNGVTFTANADGTVKANGTATADAQYAITFSNLTGNYYFSGCPSGGSGTTYELYAWDYTASARFKKWNGTTASDSDFGTGNKEINIPSGHNGSLSIRIRNGYTANNLVFKPMIRLASETDATYEPYTGNTYTINLNGTRYGGTVDLATGVLTLTHGFVTFDGSSDENWTLQTDGRRCAIRLTDCKNVEGISRTIGAISNLFEEKYPIDTWNSVIGFSIEANSDLVVRQFTTNTMTVASFKSFLQSNPMQVCYPLQTPQTVQLTPTEVKTLLGYNNISSSGTVDVIYHADTKLYIDKKIGELS